MSIDISGAILIPNLSILILNYQCEEGASDNNVQWRTPIIWATKRYLQNKVSPISNRVRIMRFLNSLWTTLWSSNDQVWYISDKNALFIFGSISQSQVQFLTVIFSLRELRAQSLSWFDVDFLSHLSVLVMYFGRLNPLIIDVVYFIRYTKPNFGSLIIHSSASYCKINNIFWKKISLNNLNIYKTGPSSIIEITRSRKHSKRSIFRNAWQKGFGLIRDQKLKIKMG